MNKTIISKFGSMLKMQSPKNSACRELVGDSNLIAEAFDFTETFVTRK